MDCAFVTEFRITNVCTNSNRITFIRYTYDETGAVVHLLYAGLCRLNASRSGCMRVCMYVQVLEDIEKEAGSFYGQVSSRPQGSASGNQRMQRGSAQLFETKSRRRVCLEVNHVVTFGTGG